MRRSIVVAAVVTAALAGPAAAEEVTVYGCTSQPGPTPGATVSVGDVSVRVPVLTDVTVCAFESATVSVDTDPIQESDNCAYGPSVHVAAPSAQVVGAGLSVGYLADGVPGGGQAVEPVDVGTGQGPVLDSGPLWMIPCRG